MSNFMLFDDSHPLFQYSGEWDTNHTGVAQAVNKTMHCTTVAGSSVLFPFNGTGFEVMTVLFPSPRGLGPDTTYTVDGKFAWSMVEGVRASDTQPRFNDSSFKGVGLSSGSHVLNITYTSLSNASDPRIFCLDGVRVESHPTATFDLGGRTVTMAVPTAGTGGGGSSSASHIAPIGGSLGGTVGLVLITVLTFLRW